MNRGTYTAATGMMAQQRRLDIAANNLANVNTRGYKADRVQFAEMLSRAVANDGGNGDEIGILAAGPEETGEDVDFGQGPISKTGNPLDLAIRGNGMFAVQTDSGIRYSRDGVFRTNGLNQLVNSDGAAVLDGDGKPIQLPQGRVQIEADGSIHEDGKSATIAKIGLYQGTFKKEGKNLYTAPDARAMTNVGASADAPSIEAGAVEGANVDPVIAMVEMIDLQRSYEISQKMAQSQDEATSKLQDTMTA